jgi:hypothetical protein
MLQNYTRFQPHYISHVSPIYDPKLAQNIPNCLAYGKYCHSPRYELGIVDGKDILMEDIRQKCAWRITYLNESNPELYWNYMLTFYDKCLNTTEGNFNYQCSGEVANSVNIQSKNIEKCVTESFKLDSLNYQVYMNNNTLLELDYEVRLKWEVNIFPTVMVNNRTIKGAWNAENLFEAICASFKNKPSACSMTFNDDNASLSFGFIMLILFIIILLNVGIVYICKTYITNRIHERVDDIEISSKINNIVTSYLALRD